VEEKGKGGNATLGRIVRCEGKNGKGIAYRME